MSAVCVRVLFVMARQDGVLKGVYCSSIYQDVPLHSEEEFMQLAPEAARSEDVLNNPHQLMLNRLSFELAERQRCAWILSAP